MEIHEVEKLTEVNLVVLASGQDLINKWLDVFQRVHQMRWELLFLSLVALVLVELELGLVFVHVEETLEVTQCIIGFFFRNVDSPNSSFASNNVTSVIQQGSSRLVLAMVLLADVITYNLSLKILDSILVGLVYLPL